MRVKECPELSDVAILNRAAREGDKVDEGEISAAKERLKQITPSSRY